MNGMLYKARIAEGTITARTFLKPGSASLGVLVADAASSKFGGVAAGSGTTGDSLDVLLIGTAEVKLGGTVAAGDLLTSSASGTGVAATTGDRVWGVALDSGVTGDIIDMLIGPSIA